MYDTSYSTSASGSMSGGTMLFYLIIAVVSIVAMWKIFTKAGEAGWKSIVPFYNLYVLLKISGMSPWWILGFFVPLVNIVASIMLGLNLAKSFGRSAVFGIFGLFIFSIVGFLMLAFGKSTYVGPGGNSAAPAAAPAPAPAA